MSFPGSSRISRPFDPYLRSSASSAASTTHENERATPSTRYGTSASMARPSTTTGRRSGPSRATSRASNFGGESQRIICALSEARGVAPAVGMAFVNVSTGEAVLSQICDNQFFASTINKLHVFEPSEILVVATAAAPQSTSNMFKVIQENVPGIRIVPADRKYWSETAGLDYITQLAFEEDVGPIKLAIGGNYFATCSLAAALKYVDLQWEVSFASHSLRIKYQPSEGTMMIDLSTIQSLELIQNLQNPKSKECLFGLMNETVTPMGSRLLRSSILQPTTQAEVLKPRQEALAEFTTKEEMFNETRKALRNILDIEKLLFKMIVVPTTPNIEHARQSINNILMLKSFIQTIPAIHEALAGARCELLVQVRDICRPESINPITAIINEVIIEDVGYETKPLDLRNQRTYAVKSGVSGLLDVARQTFKEATEDVHQHVTNINQTYEMQLETRYDDGRRYYLRVPASELEGRDLPDTLINRYRIKGYFECQTLELMKLNQKIQDSHQEVILLSDKTIQLLIDNIRGQISTLYRVCDGVAMLDMITGFCQLVTSGEDYVQPEIAERIAVKSGRHPIKEKSLKSEKFVPNDVFATRRERFQIITGCNMSGKSTYIRSIALMTVMAQVGCFVPASYASFPIIHYLFARVSMDDNIEANMSTFAAEMRETAYILRNIDNRSLAIIDELGRGTSTRDGLAIALSIAETLVDSRAIVLFATHFREIAKILNLRDGVVNMHFAVDIKENSMTMLYKLDEGFAKEEHYGLALARVVKLPRRVLEVAENVSRALEEQLKRKRASSKSFALAKRRKLLLSLKVQLEELERGPMTGEPLRNYMKNLQSEFVARMEAIDEEAAGSDADESVAAQSSAENPFTGESIVEVSGEEPARKLVGRSARDPIEVSDDDSDNDV